jgi:hypothetical protein
MVVRVEFVAMNADQAGQAPSLQARHEPARASAR